MCFFAVMLLWIASICYLGVLAFTHSTGEAEPNGIGTHLVVGSILVFFALAIVIGVSTTGYNHRR
ncbi:MAG: hypothetical protein CXZ00_02165 [Acidobacteria bacterium]|nr:MAG: hypothetical protein CXZ00_02165 [Acidobacteriota bacterium]